MAKKTNSCSQSCAGCLVLIILGGVGLYFAGGFIDRGFDALEEQPAATPIPKDVTYTITDQQILPGIKRGLKIRLNKKVSEDVLKSIAMELKNSDSNSYERTFIGYYLQGMEVNSWYWATSHFEPDLEIRIIGLTVEQEKALKQQPDDPSREIVGNWIDDRPYANSIVIFQQYGKLYMENTYKDGSSGTISLIEKKSPLGRRFDEVDGSSVSISAGDHWILDSNGNLQLRDNEGLIATAKKID